MQDIMITHQQGQVLLRMARAGIAEKLGLLRDEQPVDLNAPFLKEKHGLFVTLHKNGALRGCIGVIEPDEPLVSGIGKTARLAAFNDSRFSPLQIDEFDQVDLEVSLLSVPQKFEYDTPEDLTQRLVPFKDGVIIEKEGRRATFLPQVWEQLTDASCFLSRLCIKAGLDADEWTRGGMTVHTYRVHLFSEKK